MHTRHMNPSKWWLKECLLNLTLTPRVSANLSGAEFVVETHIMVCMLYSYTGTQIIVNNLNTYIDLIWIYHFPSKINIDSAPAPYDQAKHPQMLCNFNHINAGMLL